MVARRPIGPAARTVLLGGLLMGGCAAAAACGGGQTRGHPLDSRWDDHEGGELSAFQRRWSMPRAPELPGVVVGVVNHHTLVGRALSGGSDRWRYEHPLEGRPLIASSVVVGMGDGELFALDALTGEPHWTRKALGRLRGAGDDGDTTIVSIASLSGARSIVLAVGRDGNVVRQLHEQAVVGAPAVFDAYAFLPWNGDRVVIFDLLEGTEAARVVASEPVSHAFLIGGELYFGETSAVRFDDQIVAARWGGGSRVTLPERRWPGDPKWLLPGSQTQPTMASRDDRIRFYARPRSTASGPRLDDYALGYERLVIGLRAPRGTLRWVHTNTHTMIGGAATADSFAMCDAGGEVRWLDGTTGRLAHRLDLGERLVACQVQSERSPGDAPPAGKPASMAEQITRALQDDDIRLLPLQLELLEELAAIDGSVVSGQLIALASEPHSDGTAAAGQPRPHGAISRRARELLAARRTGPEAMLAALAAGLPSAEPDRESAHRPSATALPRQLLAWAERPRLPIGPLAAALRGMDDRRAAPLLAPYLSAPSLAHADLAEVARALDWLATEHELPWLVAFYARQRCNRGNPLLSQAVEAVERGLIRLGGPPRVAKNATDPCDRAVTRK